MADTKLVVDCSTGEAEAAPLTAEEQTQWDADKAAAAQREQAEVDAQAQREADEQAWRDALDSATTIAQLRDVLKGTNLPAQAAARIKGAP